MPTQPSSLKKKYGRFHSKREKASSRALTEAPAPFPSSSDQSVLDHDFSELDRLFVVNVRGMAACVKHAGRAMAEGGEKGSVICMAASTAASMGHVKFTDYVMSKLAVLGLVRAASLQLAKGGIRVNRESPGGVGTPPLPEMMGIVEETDLDVMVEGFSRLKGTMRDKNLADAIVFLASEESESLMGHDLVLECSWTE